MAKPILAIVRVSITVFTAHKKANTDWHSAAARDGRNPPTNTTAKATIWSNLTQPPFQTLFPSRCARYRVPGVRRAAHAGPDTEDSRRIRERSADTTDTEQYLPEAPACAPATRKVLRRHCHL